MKKLLVFDLWGTLIESGARGINRQLRDMLAPRMHFSQFIQRFEKISMTQHFPTQDSMFAQIFRTFRVRDARKVEQDIIGLENNNRLFAKAFDDTFSTLAQLRKKYKLAIFCNTNCFNTADLREKFNLDQHVDHVYFSCDVGALKGDSDMMRTILEDFEVTNKEVVIIGDSMESDMRVGEQNNMLSILMDRRGRRVYPMKISTLAELEKLL